MIKEEPLSLDWEEGVSEMFSRLIKLDMMQTKFNNC